MDERTSWYGGIADTEGLESCVYLYNREEAVAQVLESGNDSLNAIAVGLFDMFMLRARHNGHRHPIVYTALMTDAAYKRVGEVLRKNPTEAIDVLLLEAEEIKVHNAKPEAFFKMRKIARVLREVDEEETLDE